jgi:hypothetical protein
MYPASCDIAAARTPDTCPSRSIMSRYKAGIRFSS